MGFFLNTLAKKKRFLVNPPSIEVKACVLTVTAKFVDQSSKPAGRASDKVLMDLQTPKNTQALDLLSGSKQLTGTLSQTNSGVVVAMNNSQNGVYTARIPLSKPGSVQVALLAYTYSDVDKAREGSSFRRTPWRGSKYGEFGKDGYSFSSIAHHVVNASECMGKCPNKCQNGGVAKGTVVAGNCGCTCAKGYTGDTCQSKMPCPLKCVNGGQSTGSVANGNCACRCPTGFEGSTCGSRTACPHKCQNGGVAKGTVAAGNCGCTCAKGYTGDTCQSKMPCPLKLSLIHI